MIFKKNKKLNSCEFYDNNIYIPNNPILSVLKRFGRDELIALILSLVSTIIVSLFTKNILIISLSAPIFEKLGFFPGNFFDAYKQFKNSKHKQNISYYINNSFKNSFKSLLEDIFLHDPIYIFLMYFLLSIYSKPVWLITMFSFIFAVFLVSFIEVSFVEIKYFLFKCKLKKLGLKKENYYEARFIINKNKSTAILIDKLAKHFNLKNKNTFLIKDVYLENRFKEYSQRQVVSRFRTIDNDVYLEKNSFQIIYTVSKEFTKGFDQFRYFIISKEKFKFNLNKPNLTNLKKVNKNCYKLLKKNLINKSHKVSFRRIVYNSSELFLSLDHTINRNFYTLEVKVFYDKKLLIKIMKDIMLYLPVIQTTDSKFKMHRNLE
jgi:hypothetical protein